MLRISNIFIRKDISDYEVFEKAIKKHSIQKEDVLDWHISHKSIDARKKDDVHYVYAIDINVKNEAKYKKLEKVKKFEMPYIKTNNNMSTRPVVVGAGPARIVCCFNFGSKQFQTYCVRTRTKC